MGYKLRGLYGALRNTNQIYFASGPTAKPKGWNVKGLSTFTSRYHRSAKVKQALKQAHQRLKALLQLPKGYELYFTPAGASGAFECGLWNLLGQRAAVLEFDKFSHLWLKDCQRLATHTETFKAPLGKIPPLEGIAPLRLRGFDVVFVYLATTTGVVIPNEEWLMPSVSTSASVSVSAPPVVPPVAPSAHLVEESLVFADVTAAVFTHPIGWHNLDVAAFSLAKAITGEAGFGALVLSGKAQSRLAKQATAPLARPIPHIFTIPQNGWEPINTFSALAIADLLMALDWLEGIGGQPASIEKARTNRLRLAKWAEQTHWLEELAASKETRANCPATYRFVASQSPTKGTEQKEQENQKEQEAQQEPHPKETHPKERHISRMLNLLEKQYGICDISSHPSAPLGLRIWCGANIEGDAISTLTKQLEEAYRITK